MRRSPAPRGHAPVIPGPLVSLVVYAVLVRVLTIFGLLTLSYPRIDGPPVDRSPGVLLFWGMTVVHVGFAASLLGVHRRARSAPAGLRRAHLAGCALGFVLLALLQWSAIRGLGVMNAVLDGAGR